MPRSLLDLLSPWNLGEKLYRHCRRKLAMLHLGPLLIWASIEGPHLTLIHPATLPSTLTVLAGHPLCPNKNHAIPSPLREYIPHRPNLVSLKICKGIGIGCEVKRSWLRNCRVQNQAFFVGLQETKSLEEPWRKKALWNNLADLINSDADSCWIVFRDFNVVRFPEERLGYVFCQSSAYYFNEFIHSLGLLEIKMGGRRFTYMNSTGDKHSKHDRFLVSLNSIEAWPTLNVTTMPRVHSDHSTIILSALQHDFGPTPFIFFNSWLKDPGFEGVLRSGWAVSCNPGRQLILSPLTFYLPVN
uniref:Endonuclease/exonuclease/phosphatase domain-containing protein n=1 Tax=Lactuca sativa TaxID=4236 RepID=A0A9R1VQL5_LACSA|nr:hypothetical protein LSAT_V11C400195860 [Lactuca sativa]